MSRNAIRTVLGLATAAACLLAAPVSGAAPVGWNEQAKVGGKPVMSYQVASLTFGGSRWSARISFHNLSKQTIRVGSEFGVAFWATRSGTSLTSSVGFATATTFTTTPPKALRPGGSWSGVIGGTGRLASSGRVYARVVFGPFTGFPGKSAPVVWITDHAKAIGTGQLAPETTKPATVI